MVQMMHLTIGSAWAVLDSGIDYENDWTARSIQGSYGYGRLTVSNSTVLHLSL